ncbi:peptidase C19, ubiquitin carboxyl-terminal hydrolase 2 [Hymenopellis radicata]|nr:peptidase C19, ubiquitin carboxyl-terminal hydrolase 2 [Hymenopellis radicata]
MAKTKALTPQELYAARKQREEEEKQALMPPGLINQGNTCFMNSVLQGHPSARRSHLLPSPTAQRTSPVGHPPRTASVAFIDERHEISWRVPAEMVDSMPIGDVFINVMLKAWNAQRHRRRENQAPRSLLSALGRKYDQYLDFAQQDAHEFMRILLDAMRMEEFDIIKKRQPQPQPTKKRRRKQSSNAVDDEERLISLSDMIFGGKLTSILVCQKCKHVSQTYEDFNDLSLSIKPEDYAKERKRDRLKNLAKRLGVFPTSFTAHAASIVSEVAEPAHSDESAPTSDKHLEFVEAPKPEREKKNEDGWGRLGRRLSMGLYSGKERKGRSRERRSSKDLTRTESSATTVVEPVAPAPDVDHTSAQSMWFKMGQLPVRCRRCWKIANGVYTPKIDHDDSDSVDGHPVASVMDDTSQESLESTSDIPTSLSTPELSDYSRTSSDDPAASMVSLPTTIAGSTPESVDVKHASAPLDLKVSPGGLPIPSISTTAPPTPEDSPPPTARPASLDSYDSRHSNRSIDTHSNHDTRPLSLSAESLLSAPSNYRPQPQTDEEEYDDESSSSEEDDGASEAESSKPGEKRSPTKKKPKPFIIRPAYKRYLIATPPPVLVVHLKRFQQLSKTPMLSFSNGFKKLDDYVTFPEVLDLTPFLAPRKEDFARKSVKREPEKCLYRLYAVVVHIGNMLGGHYIAYTALPTPPEDQLKTPTAGAPVKPKARQWAYISDTVVRLTTLEEVLKAKAYICMYERI